MTNKMIRWSEEPGPAELRILASQIGIDYDSEGDKFGWFLISCSKVDLKNSWTKEYDPDGTLYFFNLEKNAHSYTHPLLTSFQLIFLSYVSRCHNPDPPPPNSSSSLLKHLTPNPPNPPSQPNPPNKNTFQFLLQQHAYQQLQTLKKIFNQKTKTSANCPQLPNSLNTTFDSNNDDLVNKEYRDGLGVEDIDL
jgi:hypothetical protein